MKIILIVSMTPGGHNWLLSNMAALKHGEIVGRSSQKVSVLLDLHHYVMLHVLTDRKECLVYWVF